MAINSLLVGLPLFQLPLVLGHPLGGQGLDGEGHIHDLRRVAVAPRQIHQAALRQDVEHLAVRQTVAPLGDVFVSVTGCKDVITAEHYAVMKPDALLSNAGHFDCEVEG